MKMTMLVIALCACITTIQAQDIPASQVPAPVKSTLKAKFPKATGLDWEKKGDLYEAEFRVNMVAHKALLDANGKLVVYKRDIRSADLPLAVRNTIKTQYKGFRIDDVEKVDKNGDIFYQVELDGKPQDQKLVLKGNGEVDSSQQYW